MSEPIKTIPMPKLTGTHADIFAAAGLADLLSGSPRIDRVTIVNQGVDFQIVCSGPLDETIIETIPQDPGYPFLVPNETVKAPSAATDVVYYRQEKEKADRQRQLREENRKKGIKALDAETEEQLQREQVREDWRLLQALNVLQGDETSNKVYERIVGAPPKKFHEDISQSLAALTDRRSSGIDWKASLVQLFTPSAAKGYCRLKPDQTDRNDKTKEQWSDPFVEWLKYRGYFRVACPYFSGSKGENIRLLCPIPQDVSVAALTSVAREFRRKKIAGGPPKTDSLAVLYLAEILIRHSEEFHDEEVEIFPGLSLVGKNPAQSISGISITHYQSMGSSKAVSAISVLAMPGWFAIKEPADARLWLEIIDEHTRIVRGLQDNHSDEIGLLIDYRKFLEKREEDATWRLIEFMERYGPFLIRARDQGRKVRAFRTDLFRRLIMSTAQRLSPILDDPGFVAVASAIRKATVSAQALKSMGRQDYREIRYDLLHNLRRKRLLPGTEPLVEAVSDFVCQYNQENARRRELKKQAPKNVTTEELASFVKLVEKHSASTVGALLCAYGSCREPQEVDEGAFSEEQELGEEAAEPVAQI